MLFSRRTRRIFSIVLALLLVATFGTGFQPVMAASPTTVTGQLYCPDGTTPFDGSTTPVNIYLKTTDTFKTVVMQATVNGPGGFTLNGTIETGDYTLHAEVYSSDNPYTNAVPIPIHIVEGIPVTQSISLTDPLITGTVFKPDGTPFISGPDSNVQISLTTIGKPDMFIAGSQVSNTGTFKLGGTIGDGDYRLFADTTGSANLFADEYISIHVTAGVPMTQNITLTDPSVEGFIHKPDGSVFIPVQDLCAHAVVRTTGPNSMEVANAAVETNGFFKISGNVAPGNYVILAAPCGNNNPYTEGIPVNITINAGATTIQDVTLTNPLITGTVFKPDGTPFIPGPDSNVQISLKTTGKPDMFITGSQVSNIGTFKLGGTIGDGDYLLSADTNGSANPYADEFIIIHITAGVPMTQNITLTNPSVKGFIHKPDGSVFIPGQDLDAHAVIRTTGPNPMDVANVSVEIDGSFKISGNVAPGNYVILATPCGNNNPYTEGIPVNITINAGATTIQDISLSDPLISGTVFKPDGTPFMPGSDSWVNVDLKNSQGQWFGGSQVNNNGTFNLGGNIPSGTYTLYANAQGAANPFAGASVQINFVAGVPIVQDITLVNPSVKGFIRKPDGSIFTPGPDTWISVELKTQGGQFVTSAGPDYNGSYKLPEVPTGDYVIQARSGGNNNPYGDSAPFNVHIDAGVLLTQDLTLTNLVTLVSGMVKKPDGTVFIPGPDSWATVELKTNDKEGKPIASANVKNDGTYQLNGNVAPGDYKIIASAHGINNQFANSMPFMIHIDGTPHNMDLPLTDVAVKGFVRKPDGSIFIPGPDSGVHVSLQMQGPNPPQFGDMEVESDGSFRLGGNPPAGDFVLSAYANGNNNPFTNAIPLNIHLDMMSIFNQDISLTNPLITGTIFKPDGQPFMPGPDSGVHVNLNGDQGQWFADSEVSNNGTFKLGGNIPTGDYTLFADAQGGANPYTDAFVNIHVDAGVPMVQNVTLTNPSVKGFVRKPDGTIFMPGPDSGVHLALRLPGDKQPDIAWTDVEGDGSFKLGGNIPTGDYVLYAYANGNNNPFTDAVPVNVHIDAGMLTMQDISLTNPLITGTVFNPGGAPFMPGPDMWVNINLNNSQGQWFAGSQVSNNGTFKLGGNIPTGDYTLFADAQGMANPYTDASINLHVEAGMPMVQNITLTNPSVRGFVHKPDGTMFMPGPDSGVHIALRMLGDNQPDIAGTEVENDGSFKLGGNIPTGDYMLYAYANGNNNPFTNAFPMNVHVDAGMQAWRDLTLTNPLITGTVFKPDGTPFVSGPDSWVHINLKGLQNQGFADAQVNNDGTFKLGGNIPAGDYSLFADAQGDANPFTDGFVDINVMPGMPMVQNVTLTNPLITGTVFKPDGTPFMSGPDSWVHVNLNGSQGQWFADSDVSNNGTFKLGGNIPTGDYTLSADAQGGANPFADGFVSIHVEAGVPVAQNITLTNPAIKGRVLKPDGTPFFPGPDSSVDVELRTRGPQGTHVASTGVDGNGFFVMGGIPTGDYTLYAYPRGNNNPFGEGTPIDVHIIDGNLIMQDITLTNLVTLVSGMVKNPDGTIFIPSPDSWATVELKTNDKEGKPIASANVKNDGTYQLNGNVAPGDYKISVFTHGINSQFANSMPFMIHIDGAPHNMDLWLTNVAVKGFVRKPDGSIFMPAPDSGVHVSLQMQGPNPPQFGDMDVESDGSFRLGGNPPAGDFVLSACAYGNNNPFTNAIPLNIHLDMMSIFNQDISLTNPLITGTVFKPDGQPFIPGPDSGVHVNLNGDQGQWFADSEVSNNGTFKLGGNIPTGDYTLFADANGNANPFTDASITFHVDAGVPMVQNVTLTNPSVKGFARKPDGTIFMPGPDSGVHLALRLPGDKQPDIAWTDVEGDGSFKLGGNIPTGDYILYAYANGNNNPFTDAVPVNVHIDAGMLTMQDISLTNPLITGTVFNSGGAPFMPGPDMWVNVNLNNSQGQWFAGSNVSNNGTFKLGGNIPTGDYTLFADAQGMANPYTDASINFHVEAGMPMVQNITLTNPSVRGFIRKPDGTMFMPGPDSGVHVALRMLGDNQPDIAGTEVESDGSFKLGGNIPTGDYMLYAYANGNNNPFTNAFPMNVHVDAGMQAWRDLTLTNPLITGTIFKPDGTPFMSGPDSWVHVNLNGFEGQWFADSQVNNNGTFKLGGNIPTGDYTLFADAQGGANPYTDAFVNIHVEAGMPMVQNVTLTNPSVKGFVRKPDGTVFMPGPDSGVHLALRMPGDKQPDLAWTDVEGDGSFKLGGNIPTGDYVLYAYANGNNNPFTDAVPVNVPIDAGMLTMQDISLTNPLITGTVFNPGGAPFMPGPDMWVNVNLNNSQGQWFAGSNVSNNGTFKLGGNIPTGDYTLFADAQGMANPYTDAFVNIHVEAGIPMVQNITLTNPSVRGFVRKPDGTMFMPGPDSGVHIALRLPGNNQPDIAWTDVENDGSFRLGGNIPTGEYMLYAYANGNNNPFTDAFPMNVHVDVGMQAWRDLTLTNPLITGIVFKPDGTPFMSGPDSWVNVDLKSIDPNNQWGTGIGINSNGTFKLGGNIPAGNYMLRADAQGNANPFADASINIQVTVGIPMVQNLTLTNPSVKGVVRKPDGSPFFSGPDAWVDVELKTLDGLYITSTGIDSDGSYKLSGNVATGDYRLYAHSGGFNNPFGEAQPLNIHIDAGMLVVQDLTLTEGMIPDEVVEISGGEKHTLAVMKDGTAWAWGANANGQLGNGSTEGINNPMKIPGLDNVSSVAAGYAHSMALKKDGTVWTWGANNLGQLGDGSTQDKFNPIMVNGLNNVIDIATGWDTSVALKGDGTVWAWGVRYGNIPVQIIELFGVKAVESGKGYVLALKNDGTVWGVGMNDHGQLGDGTTVERFSPVQVAGLMDVKAISTKSKHTIAIKNDGTVWTWGLNDHGQIGDGTTVDRLLPYHQNGLGGVGVASIAAGSWHSVVVNNIGTVWTWGANAHGQLGDATNMDRLLPTVTGGIPSLKWAATGFDHTFAVEGNNTIWTWGANGSGQLGDGSQQDTNMPVKVQWSMGPKPIKVNLMLDKALYNPGETVNLTLKLNEIEPGSRTNSVAFEVTFDGNAFEFNNAASGYIPFNSVLNTGSGANKKIVLSYIDLFNNVNLQENATVFTIQFTAKDPVVFGTRTFTLNPVNMADSDGKMYNVNDTKPSSVSAGVGSSANATVEGYVSIYLGTPGMPFYTTIMNELSQSKINEAFRRISFIVKKDESDSGMYMKGSDVFVPDINGNLAALDANNKVTGMFRFNLSDPTASILRIADAGYLAEYVGLALIPGQTYNVSTAANPIQLYPGDIARPDWFKIELKPDERITTADFTAWQRVYNDFQQGKANPEDVINADFTRNGVLNDTDYQLWRASYDIVSSQP